MKEPQEGVEGFPFEVNRRLKEISPVGLYRPGPV